MYSLTSNQYWRGIGKRFDRRCKLLLKMGFSRLDNEFGSFFVKGMIRTNKLYNKIIPSCILSSADNRQWHEKLRQILR